MKKITLLFAGFVFAALSANVSAQTYDVGVTGLPTVSGTPTVYPNVPTNIEYTRENFGAAVTSSVVDSFTMEIFIDQIKRFTFYRNMGAPFAVSASETTQGVTPADWSTLGLSAGTIPVCVRTRLWKGGALIDANPNNDEKCEGVVYAGDNNPLTYDLSIGGITVADVFNTYPNNSQLPKGMTLSEIGFDLINAGTNQLPAGVTFGVNVDVDGTAYGPFGGTTQAMSAPGSVIYTIDAFANGIFLPSGKTQFDICVELVATTNDTDNSNDGDCSTFTIPVGIEESGDASNFEMNYFNRVLTINSDESINGQVEVSIISMSGQLVQSNSFNADIDKNYELDLNQLTSGAFIAKVKAENGAVETARFIVE
ncbi:MAG: T9SS type A sorting domain-containing protein [Vicingaceae bacterium]